MPKLLLNCLVVAGAGALGAVSRYAVSLLFTWTTFPLGTFLINLTGSFILGWFMVAFGEKVALSDPWRLAIAVGFLGAYTTFSSFMYESDKMLQNADWLRAAAYLAGSVFLGLLAVRLGMI